MSKKAELIGSYFGAIYLTVISLLQGIALSQLVPIIITYLGIAEHPWTDIHILPLALMLLVIFIVWHHYAMGIFYLRWFPNIIDTLIPFLLGLGQFILISFLNIKTSLSEIQMEPWTIGFGIFLLLGSPAYFAAAFRLDADSFINIMSMDHAVSHVRISRKYYTMAGFSVLFQGLFVMLIILTHRQELLWASLILFMVHLAWSEYYILSTIQPHFVMAMKEYDRNN